MLEAALAADLTLDEALDSTFYLIRIAVQVRSKRMADQAVATGWWAERFAREKMLKALPEYLDTPKQPEPASALTVADWAKRNDTKFRKGAKK